MEYYDDGVRRRPIKLRHAPARAKKGKDNPYYVGTKELKDELKRYFASGTCAEDRVISKELGEMLIKISTRYASKPCFSGYYYKQEFISEAIFQMVKKLSKINLDHPRCNPFSYLTCICYCAFVSTINHYNKTNKKMKELRDKIYEEFCLSEGINIKKELNEFLTSGDIDKELYDEILQADLGDSDDNDD